MVKLNKTLPLPKNIHIRSYKDWGNGTDVRRLLEDDCYGKCYICEDKPETCSSLTVEHVESKRFSPNRQYDWKNLLLACRVCNEVKGHEYNNVINPCVEDPEAILSFGLRYDNSKVEIASLNTHMKAEDTKQLLELIYNYSQKGKMFILPKLRKEIKKFTFYLDRWDFGDTYLDQYIREDLSRSSPFAAFKRKIVRDSPKYMEQFGDALV